jgi:integrase/recombinase XerD
MQPAEQIKKACIRRGYSNKTADTYAVCINKFFRYCKKDPRSVKKTDIEIYINRLIKRDKARSTVNVHLSAIQFYYKTILKRNVTVNLPYMKQQKKVSEWLTKEEVIQLLNQIKNKKHLLLTKLLFSSGMRVSEIVNLKVKDLEFDQSYGWVRQGKGNKDRMFIIAENLKQDLIDWIKNNNLVYSDYIFSGHNKHLSVQSVQQIIKKAAKQAKIKKNVHPHTLRHSFATQLLENGYQPQDIQPLLGHSHLETTLTYLHALAPKLLKVQSPLDVLQNHQKV